MQFSPAGRNAPTVFQPIDSFFYTDILSQSVPAVTHCFFILYGIRSESHPPASTFFHENGTSSLEILHFSFRGTNINLSAAPNQRFGARLPFGKPRTEGMGIYEFLPIII